MEDQARLTAWVTGRVQGVGFRWWVRSVARELGLVGVARNLPDGRVEVIAEGPRAACEQLLAALGGPPNRGRPGFVASVASEWSSPRGDFHGFEQR